MSGLEKFQDNRAWRQKLLNHLLSDRAPRVVVKPQDDSMDRRHSLDIVLDFPALMKAKKAELANRQNQDEIKAASAINTNTNTNINSETETTLKSGGIEQKVELDESFDALERMCDKTASDPDSTLFHYLHSDDKVQVLALAKERNSQSNNSSDMEIDSMRRMLNEMNGEELLNNESPLKSVECTQLEDIEEPSRFWDNDVTLNSNDSSVLQPLVKISPVKMVGLLRPSTILEANEADLTGMNNSNSSFKTADTLETAQSFDTIASSSSCYETAADSSLASISSKAATTLNIDDLFYAAIAKAKPPGMSKAEQDELLCNLDDSLMNCVLGEELSETIVSDAAENTIIELSSSSEEEELDFEVDIKQDASFIDENKENKSIHFNDTIEEMEYMMQKGMDIMAAKVATSVPSPATKHTTTRLSNQILPKQNTFVLTPEKVQSKPLQPGSSKSSNKQPPAASIMSHYNINMDLPKSKFFKHPTGIPMSRQQLKVQKNHFAHIVSPIRTYIQKSGIAPLMSQFRQTQNITDSFNSLSIMELEQESRICQLKRTQSASTAECFNPCKEFIDGIDSTACFLPKKAYISSELKRVVDERTPMPMPSVPKIQKYLNTAVEPTVLRHDGKMKMPETSGKMTSHIPRRTNQSLADLSLLSGDISLYTLKDAQKFK